MEHHAIFKYADLSLCHLKPETIDYLESKESVVCSYPFHYGMFVFVAGDNAFSMERIIPSDLFEIFVWARDNDVIFIKFDEEGYIVDELPRFDKLNNENVSRCCK